MDVEAIMQIPISHTTHQDIWAWHYEKTGVFSVRSTYKMLIETKQRRENWLEGRAASSSTEEDENQWKKAVANESPV
jgi:hypothetical protein